MLMFAYINVIKHIRKSVKPALKTIASQLLDRKLYEYTFSFEDIVRTFNFCAQSFENFFILFSLNNHIVCTYSLTYDTA